MIEQRAHYRVAVDFDAFVTAEGLSDYPCRVRDFCLGGVLLSFEDPLRPPPEALQRLERGSTLQMRIVARAPGHREPHVFTAVVARRDRAALGVSFTRPDPTSLMALQSLANVAHSQARQTRLTDKPRKPRMDEAAMRRIIVRLRTEIARRLTGVPADFFAGLRKPLEELLLSSAGVDDRSRHLEEVATVRRSAESVRLAFMRHALKPLDDLDKWKPGMTLAPVSSAHRLSLIEKSAFEDWLAIKVMISRAESECQELLFELQLRLNELLSTHLGSQNNPLGPGVFFQALGEPVQKMRLPKPVEQVVMRGVETTLMTVLPEIYRAANELLAREGVLPDLEISKHYRHAAVDEGVHAPRRVDAQRPLAGVQRLAAWPTDAGSSGVPSFAPPPGVSGMASPTLPSQPPPHSVAPSSPPPPVAAPVPTLPETPPPSPAGSTPAPSAPAGERSSLAARQFDMQQRIARHAYSTVQRLLALPKAAEAATASPDSAVGGPDDERSSGAEAPHTDPAAAESTESSTSRVPESPAWDRPSVEHALRRVQQSTPMPEEGDTASLRQRLEGALNDGQEQSRPLAATEADAADTVDELFTQMLSTPLLRDDSKQLIRRLDAPFLRLMLADQDFLADDRHPARQVLNRLASLGARGGMTTAQQQASVAEIVGTLAKFEHDIAVFEQAVTRLDRLLEQQKRIYERNLARVQQASAGQHRVAAARRRVLHLIEEMLGGRRVPKALLTLLDAGWRESMVSTLLRRGEHSAAWHEQVDVITQMLRAPENPAAIDMKALLGAIKRGLSQQASGQINRDAVVSDLRAMFTALAAGNAASVPAVDMPAGAVAATEVVLRPVEATDLARWLKQAQEVGVGDWIEFRTEGQEAAHQARLAWCDEDRTQFVFVNLHGMKVHDLDVEGLARALRDGRAWRVEDPDSPIVDRGLEAMVQKVYGQLSHRATHDDLTGLLNRKEFEKRLQRRLLARQPGSAPERVCWIDLDQFKVVNTSGGFEAGNALIKEVSRLLQATAGDNALVARIGGDEFALLLPAGAAGDRSPLDGIRSAIDALRFNWKGQVFPLGMSAGVVTLDEKVAPGADLLRCAESACYAAKEAGRNRIQVFQPDNAELSRREESIRWVARLNQAIEENRLLLRCQRIQPVDPQSGFLPHYEVLIALQGEDGEFIPPSSFLQAAERYNRMHALDRWVIHNTLRWMHANPQRLATLGGLSINLSGQSLNDENLTAYILREIGQSSVARDKISFEVTETAAIANLASAVAFIRELQAVGCHFALDDFGSGLSSYSYLKNLPVDYVKIDGAFVKDIDSNPSDYMMVRSINEMAHFMGKRTIAEYVENETILARLREIGVDFAQGYGIEKPRPLDSL